MITSHYIINYFSISIVFNNLNLIININDLYTTTTYEIIINSTSNYVFKLDKLYSLLIKCLNFEQYHDINFIVQNNKLVIYCNFNNDIIMLTERIVLHIITN
jgi:hypothetical protein